MNSKQIEKRLEYRFDDYTQYCFTLAKEVFKFEILPWLKKYNLEFISGNGDYYISHTKNTPKWFVRKYRGYYSGAIDQDKINSRIRNLLESEIPGLPANNLGSLMPDYSCEE